MAAFGREAGPSTSVVRGNPFSNFPSKEIGSSAVMATGAVSPVFQTQNLVAPQNSRPLSHSPPLRATWVSQGMEGQRPPPLAYTTSGVVPRPFYSSEPVSGKPANGGIRSSILPFHDAYPPLKGSRPGVRPYRPVDSPYVWVKGQTPAEKSRPVEVASNVYHNSKSNLTSGRVQTSKTVSVPPKKEQGLNDSQHDSSQRSLFFPQTNQSNSIEKHTRSVEHVNRMPIMYSDIYDTETSYNGERVHSTKQNKISMQPMSQIVNYADKDDLKDSLRSTFTAATNHKSSLESSIKTSTFTNKEENSTRSSSFPVAKRTRSLLDADADEVPPNITDDNVDGVDREAQAKAKRFARFKQELGEDALVGSYPTGHVMKRKGLSKVESIPKSEDVQMESIEDMVDDFSLPDCNSDKLKIITGMCPDMCPESERAERERKGDLDQYERLDGDRNQSSRSLAVKKYNRTAEREASLIRPMPVLQTTMQYLLTLLDLPYGDKFLGMYNFLWDRMRAIRMDLRMQHLFNRNAITMLEQMIRLHVVAMHELCEYSKGEGFAEGFDAHLNIEQMNKTSVELFQLYDDHRNEGIHVPTESEFRGYYALLKLDKHPGYKVDPGELSLDLSKMTPETRQTPQVLFARDVARACRAGNFVAFFRLARKASYLQACLMHAHFAKLRVAALAAIHSGLQMNQGLPVRHVAQWLAMEDEDMESMISYHGLAIKEYEEPYMVKDAQFLNGDKDYPIKCSKLVHSKRSRRIVDDVVESAEPALVTALQSEPSRVPVASDDRNGGFSPNIRRRSLPLVDEQMLDVEQLQPEVSLHVPQLTLPFIAPPSTGSHPISFPGFPLGSSSPKPIVSPRSSQTNSSRVKSAENSAPETVSPRDDVMPDPTPSLDVHRSSIIDEEEEKNLLRKRVDDEVSAAKIKLSLRIWKRRACRLADLREQRQIAAAAALGALTLGPSVQHFDRKQQPTKASVFHVDSLMRERFAKHEECWSIINVSDVVGDIVKAKNPHTDHLFWKVLLLSPSDTQTEDKFNSNLWLKSKLMPPVDDAGVESLVSASPSLKIWKKRDNRCCVSFVRDAEVGDRNEAVAGASGILFAASERISWSLQKSRLLELISFLPAGASVPLLVLTCSPDTAMTELGLADLDRTRVLNFRIVPLVEADRSESSGRFLSDSRLREGLRWLASNSPAQPDLLRAETKQLVLYHLKFLLKERDRKHGCDAAPDLCVSAFNKALELTLRNVVDTAEANRSGFPCPETQLLEGKTNLPPAEWSAADRIEAFLHGVRAFYLPAFPDTRSWIKLGEDCRAGLQNAKMKLQHLLATYMTENCGMMGLQFAAQEAHIMLQRCTALSASGSRFFLIPNWRMIFARIFNWRLMALSDEALSSTYILRSLYDNLVGKDREEFFDAAYLSRPTLDEMIDACCRPPPCEADRNVQRPASERVTSGGSVDSGEQRFAPCDAKRMVSESCEMKMVDRLSQLLARCDSVQTAIDRKLRFYF